ncbi:MAG: hypothetical protein EP332_04775 [Bacteroidetes bacterium]|nr:MAG: hypothetical protein EP332_04775 [Bacteroidota bacterium]
MKYFFSLLFLVLSLSLSAQKKDTNSVVRTGFICQFTYDLNFPTADLKQRYGLFNGVGTGVYYKTGRNWIWGAEGSYLFGNSIKEVDLFDAFTDADGYAIDHQGNRVEILAQMRGLRLFVKGGKIIPLGRNKNSGLMLSVGFGYMEHFIRATNRSTTVAALEGDLKFGYDRLASGFTMNQFVGYQFLDPRRRINFFAGVEFTQGYTQGRRAINFDTGLPGNEKRSDGSIGIRIGWLLPIYTGSALTSGGYKFR